VLLSSLPTGGTIAACSRLDTIQRYELTETSAATPIRISEDQARQIARRDAEAKYSDLTKCSAQAKLEGTAWHVEYVYIGKGVGGCPIYVIDAHSGQILSKEYYQ